MTIHHHRWDGVTRFRKEQLGSGGAHALRRECSSTRLAELEGQLAALIYGRRAIDIEINRESCGLGSCYDEGVHRALMRRATNERRIVEVATEMAEIMSRPPESLLRSTLRRHIVMPGSTVDVYFGADPRDVERLVIGPARPGGTDRCSTQSPLGRALLGRRAGQTVRYRCADGRDHVVTIVRLA